MQGSSYRITSGGTTSRSPSLVEGIHEPQTLDGFNDVGWSRLSGSVLGVTWSSTSIDEADMAINQSFPVEHGDPQSSGPVRPPVGGSARERPRRRARALRRHERRHVPVLPDRALRTLAGRPQRDRDRILTCTARARTFGIGGAPRPQACAAICGPTTVTSGIGCSAHCGGSTPAASAAMRAQWRSKPAGVQTSR